MIAFSLKSLHFNTVYIRDVHTGFCQTHTVGVNTDVLALAKFVVAPKCDEQNHSDCCDRNPQVRCFLPGQANAPLAFFKCSTQ